MRSGLGTDRSEDVKRVMDADTAAGMIVGVKVKDLEATGCRADRHADAEVSKTDGRDSETVSPRLGSSVAEGV